MKKIFSVILGLSVFGISAMSNVFASPPKRVIRSFTPNEDQLIIQHVQQYGERNWKIIAETLKRDIKTVIRRYREWLKETPEEKVPWTEESDRLLKEKVQQYGLRWNKISLFLPGYTPVQIHDRYNFLTRCQIRYTPDEDQLIIQHVQEHGERNWKIIAETLKRTEFSVYKRWHTYLLRKELEEKIPFSNEHNDQPIDSAPIIPKERTFYTYIILSEPPKFCKELQ